MTSAVALIAVAALSAARARPVVANGTFTVMTFNIQHGIDGSHRYNLQRAIDVIAKVRPDLVGLQEVTRNHPYYNCDDQPAKIAAGLRVATGRAWVVAYEQEWFTPNVECQQSGRGDGKETEGLALLAPAASLGGTTMTPLPVSRIAFAVKAAPGAGIPVIVTHLANGKQNGEARQKEIAALLPWAKKLGTPRILMGDFNATIEEPELQPLVNAYRDAWMAGVSASAATGDQGTHGDKRIDFILFDGLQLAHVETVDTRTLFGAAASDHRPVIATFRVGPRS